MGFVPTGRRRGPVTIAARTTTSAAVSVAAAVLATLVPGGAA
jgi:hypothetical protein